MALMVLGSWIALLLFSGIGAIAITGADVERGRLNATRIGGFFAGFLVALVFRTGHNKPARS